MTGMRRSACPSLSAPMATGDGLLVRLTPRHGALDARQLAGIAAAAGRFGNGLIEITARGSLQLRGLQADTVAPLTGSIAALGIAPDPAPEIRTNALAGRDATELVDPRLLADAIRAEITTRGLAGRLAPKVSIVVDGAGALPLAGLKADLRFEAVAVEEGMFWAVRIGGDGRIARTLGLVREEAAASAAGALLAAIASIGPSARGRDLDDTAIHPLQTLLQKGSALPVGRAASPVGTFALKNGKQAFGIALPFGQIEGAMLARLAASLDPASILRLAPDRGLLILDLSAARIEQLRRVAADFHFVTDPGDRRLRVVACAGAPACASAYLPTKEIAAGLAATVASDALMLHVSGCGKRCAQPSGAAVSLVGTETGVEITGDGVELSPTLRRQLDQRAASYAGQFRRRRA